MAKKVKLMKVSMLLDNSIQEAYVQQVTEKLVVVIDSVIKTIYFRRNTGFPYNSKDLPEEVGVITPESLKKIEDFMSTIQKPKWHSGWKQGIDAQLECYEFIDCTAVSSSQESQPKLQKVSLKEEDKSLKSQVFEEDDFDTSPDIQKKESYREDEFDDTPSNDFEDDEFFQPAVASGSEIDEMFR